MTDSGRRGFRRREGFCRRRQQRNDASHALFRSGLVLPTLEPAAGCLHRNTLYFDPHGKRTRLIS
jgi:hypothetical protein